MAQDMQQEQEQSALMQQHHKGKGKTAQKVLTPPPSLVANPECMKKLDTFMEAFPFEDRHKERLMAYMAMGGARNPAALLVGIVKTMEDGEFKPRDAESRAQFRRAKELKQEAVEAQQALKGTGSIRQKFMAQQKKHNHQLEANREDERGRGRSDSRDRRRRGSRSRSRGGKGKKGKGGKRGRSRSRSRGR